MNSPTETVNSFMQWLNKTFGLSLPTLPLNGWPAAVITLWHFAVDWLPGASPLPASIKVDGKWKPFDGGNFEVKEITIEIRHEQ